MIANKKILVTGGCGFIGSHVCERLIKEGADVVVLDDFSTGNLENLKEIINKVTVIEGKVEDYNTVLRATKDCNIIIHEAFPYGKSGMGLNQQYIEVGVKGTFNVLKASVNNKIENVINVSSVAAYGLTPNNYLRENTVGVPFLPYGVTKLSGELYCQAFSKLYGLNTVSLRYFYVYGPRYAQFDHNALVNFLNRALEDKPLLIYGDGMQIRDYTYITDIVEGTILAMLNHKGSGDVYNISRGKGISIYELAKNVANCVGNNIKIKFADVDEYRFGDENCKIPIGMTTKKDGKWIDERNYIGNIEKAKKELNYNPKTEIKKGIEMTAKWLKKIKEL